MSTTIPKPNRMTQNKHTTKNQLSRKQIDKCRIFYDCRSSRSADEQNSMWYWFPLTSSKHVHKSQFPIWLEQEEHRTAAAAFIQGASNVNKTLFTNSFKQGKNRGKTQEDQFSNSPFFFSWYVNQPSIYWHSNLLCEAPLVKHNTAVERVYTA